MQQFAEEYANKKLSEYKQVIKEIRQHAGRKNRFSNLKKYLITDLQFYNR